MKSFSLCIFYHLSYSMLGKVLLLVCFCFTTLWHFIMDIWTYSSVSTFPLKWSLFLVLMFLYSYGSGFRWKRNNSSGTFWFFNILLHHILCYAFNSFVVVHHSSKYLYWDVFCFDLFTKSLTKIFFCKFFTCYYNGCLSVENYQVVCLSNIWVTTVVNNFSQ